jgi:hypothetical protein
VEVGTEKFHNGTSICIKLFMGGKLVRQDGFRHTFTPISESELTYPSTPPIQLVTKGFSDELSEHDDTTFGPHQSGG